MNKPDQPRKALGKGLGALLPTRTMPVALPPPAEPPRDEIALDVPLDSIDPNPHQPRRVFEQTALEELAQSIRANGIIQPLVVRKAGERYQLVAGERRWRAARIAEKTLVPIVVRDIPDDRLLEVTLIENIQREDLNPLEFAHALQRMSQELNLKPEEIGHRTGKDRSTVLNHLRMLQLPPDLQSMVGERKLTPGHARCLLALGTAEAQRDVATRAVKYNWSVRRLEGVIKKVAQTGTVPPKPEAKVDPNVKAAIEELAGRLGTKVRLHAGRKNRGRIEIEYYSAEDLERIYETIMGR